jgi:hypothetical protein
MLPADGVGGGTVMVCAVADWLSSRQGGSSNSSDTRHTTPASEVVEWYVPPPSCKYGQEQTPYCVGFEVSRR